MKVSDISIIFRGEHRILHYDHRVRGEYRVSGHDYLAKPIFFFSCLAQFSSSSSYHPLKIILKQLFTSELATQVPNSHFKTSKSRICILNINKSLGLAERNASLAVS